MHAERKAQLERWESESRSSDEYLDTLADRIEAAQAAARARRGQAVPESLRRTALHESGHVLVALAMGHEVHGVCVDPGGRSGATWLRNGHGGGAVSMAGAVAEVFAGNYGAEPSAADLRLAPVGSARSLATFAAEDLVALNRNSVERLAEALIRLGYLDGHHLSAFIGAPRLPTMGVV